MVVQVPPVSPRNHRYLIQDVQQDQLKANIATYKEERPLTRKEMEGLLSIAASMVYGLVPCTSCRYCTDHSPQGIDIPCIIEFYNEHVFTGDRGGGLLPR